MRSPASPRVRSPRGRSPARRNHVPAPVVKAVDAAERRLLNKIRDEFEQMKWPIKNPVKDGTRANVLMKPADTIAAFALGTVRRYDLPGVLVNSQYNRKFPELYQMLKNLMAMHDPKFRYNAIQINRNVQTKPHHDRNNAGPSYCLAIGDYEGGGLTIYPEGAPAYTLDNRYKWVLYNGAKLEHGSAPTRNGVRYALVFYQSTPHGKKLRHSR